MKINDVISFIFEVFSIVNLGTILYTATSHEPRATSHEPRFCRNFVKKEFSPFTRASVLYPI